MAAVHLCLGIDPSPEGHDVQGFRRCLDVHRRFLDEAPLPSLCYLKVNLSFFLRFGQDGIVELTHFFKNYRQRFEMILDAKFNEIGNSLKAQLQFATQELGAHHVTLNPWFGWESVTLAQELLAAGNTRETPFCKTPTVFVLGATSEQSWSSHSMCANAIPYLLPCLEQLGERRRGVGFVVGANRTDVFDDLVSKGVSQTLLAPGLGAQGASWQVLQQVKNYGGDIIFPVSRGIFSGGNVPYETVLQAFANCYSYFKGA